MKLRPVLLAIPQDEALRTPDQVRRQRRCARLALQHCATLSGLGSTEDEWWQKDAKDVPLPWEGYHWSVSHKPRWAAAVIDDRPVGIDIEHVAPRRRPLFDSLADEAEWAVAGGQSWEKFFRLWTAKEATLKANGVGISRLLECRLLEIPDESHMVLDYGDRVWRVEQYYHDDHMAAVTCEPDAVEWHVLTRLP